MIGSWVSVLFVVSFGGSLRESCGFSTS
jgi:hypothetical protein